MSGNSQKRLERREIQTKYRKMTRQPLSPVRLLIECFHSRGKHLCKFIGTKESVCIRKEFNSHTTGLGHKHGHRFIVLEHQVAAVTSFENAPYIERGQFLNCVQFIRAVISCWDYSCIFDNVIIPVRDNINHRFQPITEKRRSNAYKYMNHVSTLNDLSNDLTRSLFQLLDLWRETKNSSIELAENSSYRGKFQWNFD